MQIFSRLILLVFSITGTIGASLFFSTSSYASWWSETTTVDETLCPTGTCNLQGGVDATKTILNGSGINTTESISKYVIRITLYILSFVTLIAVIFVIYAGFQLMIGGGDEEKLKKTKSIITHVVLGMVVMWLAWAIVNLIVSTLDGKTSSIQPSERSHFTAFLIPEAKAYTENDIGTFSQYDKEIQAVAEILETEFRLNSTVTAGTVAQAKQLVNDAYLRLPDNPDTETKNASAKRAADLAIDLMAKNPSSQTDVQNGVGGIMQFIRNIDIQRIEGRISATPVTGSAPLSVSFRAQDIVDPSGVNPVDSNYIWWTRENGGQRREIGRGQSLMYTFSKEGTYQIFLDVISGSKNKKGYTDVLPLSVSQQIQVTPRVGNIILLINGVNVSNLDTIKINPTIGKLGILFDATASRAVSNGSIIRTTWDFGNGNTYTHDGPPTIERQIFANQETYKVSLILESNDQTIFSKQLQIVVRDPASVISMSQESGHIGNEISFSALSYFSNSPNIQHTWKIQRAGGNATDKPLIQKEGAVFTYKFPAVGDYIVTLSTRNANGETDQDSKVITIESREPVINLASPVQESPEKPNTIVFDASTSYDPDTQSRDKLKFEWKIDGAPVILKNQSKGGSVGSLSFDKKGPHTVSLTVSNEYGKVATTEQSFDVTSTLAVSMNIVPRAVQLGNKISIQARAPKAMFYEWDLGDGSARVSGTTDSIETAYKRTGIYTVTLTVKNNDGSEVNTISRDVYVTDTNNPYALININYGNNDILENQNACDGNGAFVVSRSTSTQIDGSQSLNTDGTNDGLSYTWKYLDRVKTGPTLSEMFTELGCFPIELTVRSDKNGATHTNKQYIQVKNLPPTLTSISTTIDQTKKDSQKILVNVTANGAQDADGVITSYIWFYKTESDSEPQSIRITQSPTTTFVLPNVTEKYFFGVILEDNDGAKVSSIESLREQAPLIISNENGNINLPLITLAIGRSQVLAGEPITFAVSAKNILGSDITNKSEYQWDFDGDGRVDQKTSEPRVTYAYPTSGNFNMRVKVTYNGISNSKYQTIIVKNELKAGVQGYRSGNSIMLVNMSAGSYDRALWKVGSITSENLGGIIVSGSDLASGTTSMLTVSSGENESSSIEITPERIETLERVESGMIFQSSPKAEGDTITIKSRGDRLLIGTFGNGQGLTHEIDANSKIDSNTDGDPENDIDNKGTSSLNDGSMFVLNDIHDIKTREREILLRLKKNGVVQAEQKIKVILEYLPNNNEIGENNLENTDTEAFSTKDKENLEQFQKKVRSLETDDRIILTQAYNGLIENWNDTNARTEKLIEIQNLVNDSQTLKEGDKTELSGLIDTILVGDAQATNEITVASALIANLIPTNHPNRSIILEKLDQITSHPGELATNKAIGKEILEMIKDDKSIKDADKLLIKTQLSIIVNGGQASVPESEVPQITSKERSGILGFLIGAVKIFAVIIGSIVGIVFIGYIIYLITRKNKDIGFQDFLIDSIFHAGKQTQPETPVQPKPAPIETTKVTTVVDPLLGTSSQASTYTETEIHPVKPITQNTTSVTDPLSGAIQEEPISDQNVSIPDWLKPLQGTAVTEDRTYATVASSDNDVSDGAFQETVTEKHEISSGTVHMSDMQAPLPQEVTQGEMPDWLKTEAATPTSPETPVTDTQTHDTPITTSSEPGELPDWLFQSAQTNDEMVSKEETKDPLEMISQEKDPFHSETTDTNPEEVPPASDPEENNIPQKEKQKKRSPKRKAAPAPDMENEAIKQKSTPAAPADDLPDWLK